MAEKSAKEPQFPTYKGKPLVRCGDVLYYGSMADRYVVRLEVKSKKKVKDMDVADKVSVQLMLTDQTNRSRKQIVKTSEKSGLYLAMDLAEVWLRRALAET
ncbi:hypothetical protein [Thermocaproicibacter melissae]|uniref:hypothetical protein n=1 Tax=Thermocaproicibacter melissae TaxID=2966552 RepID=UPI0024B26E0D|nr:hypothetical protein [Thermocaproicibacter melissae]WBY63425.1 hypothetical protein NOG13_05480 [Thermocaproicibacter melissae]